MATKLKISKGSMVEVIAGSEKGKKGSVLSIDPVKMKIKVQGVGMKTHFDKENVVSLKEGFVDYSNVKLVEKASPKGKKATKKASAKA